MNPSQEHREEVISDINKKSGFRGLLLPLLSVVSIATLAIFYVYFQDKKNSKRIESYQATQINTNTSNANTLSRKNPIDTVDSNSYNLAVSQNAIRPVIVEAESQLEPNHEKSGHEGNGYDEGSIGMSDIASNIATHYSTSEVAEGNVNSNGNMNNKTVNADNNTVEILETMVIPATVPAMMSKRTKNTEKESTGSVALTKTEEVITVTANSLDSNEVAQITDKTTNDTKDEKDLQSQNTATEKTDDTMANKPIGKEEVDKKQTQVETIVKKSPQVIEPIIEQKETERSVSPDNLQTLTTTQIQHESIIAQQEKISKTNRQRAINDAKLLDIDMPQVERNQVIARRKMPENWKMKSDMKTLHNDLSMNIQTIKTFNQQTINKNRQVDEQAYQDHLYIKELKKKEVLIDKIEEKEAQLEQSITMEKP